ncbi:MAG: type III pantothenate kinase, partial [Clostridia bacterium]|nr:type III pantothenate kinase [Clostridia bacterium]
MILCIDIGNTNIKYAIFDGDELKFSFRVATDLKRTSDEYGAQLAGMLEFNGISVKDITGGIISSVVPSLDYTIEHMLGLYLGITPKLIAPGLKTGLSMRADNAREVGADRIVNNVAAIKKYGAGKPIIVIDFGTATTFNIINEKSEFIGGVIAPGIRGSLDSLVSGTAKLPRVEIEAPKSVIATNTVT